MPPLTKPDPMSVTMQTSIVVKIGNLKQRLSMEEARDLHARLCRFIIGSNSDGKASHGQCQEAERVRQIKACTINHFGLDAGIFASRARHQTYSWPRTIAIGLSKEMTTMMTLVEIGNEFGRDHGTVLYAVKEMANRLATYPEKRKDVDAIRAKLNGNGGAH